MPRALSTASRGTEASCCCSRRVLMSTGTAAASRACLSATDPPIHRPTDRPTGVQRTGTTYVWRASCTRACRLNRSRSLISALRLRRSTARFRLQCACSERTRSTCCGGGGVACLLCWRADDSHSAFDRPEKRFVIVSATGGVK